MTIASPISPVEARLRQILERRIMILDGAMGTIIQQYKLDEQAYRGQRFADFKAPEGSGARELFVRADEMGDAPHQPPAAPPADQVPQVVPRDQPRQRHA